MALIKKKPDKKLIFKVKGQIIDGLDDKTLTDAQAIALLVSSGLASDKTDAEIMLDSIKEQMFASQLPPDSDIII